MCVADKGREWGSDVMQHSPPLHATPLFSTTWRAQRLRGYRVKRNELLPTLEGHRTHSCPGPASSINSSIPLPKMPYPNRGGFLISRPRQSITPSLRLPRLFIPSHSALWTPRPPSESRLRHRLTGTSLVHKCLTVFSRYLSTKSVRRCFMLAVAAGLSVVFSI